MKKFQANADKYPAGSRRPFVAGATLNNADSKALARMITGESGVDTYTVYAPDFTLVITPTSAGGLILQVSEK
jgi:hypothetical protein